MGFGALQIGTMIYKIIFDDPCNAAYVPVDDKVAPNLNHLVGEDLFAGVQLTTAGSIRERIDPKVNELISVRHSVRNGWFTRGEKDVEHGILSQIVERIKISVQI